MMRTLSGITFVAIGLIGFAGAWTGAQAPSPGRQPVTAAQYEQFIAAGGH